jgi:hypothetical protein
VASWYSFTVIVQMSPSPRRLEVARGLVVHRVLPSASAGTGVKVSMPQMKPTTLLARFGFEEGAVAAVMEHDEHAHQQAGRRARRCPSVSQ